MRRGFLFFAFVIAMMSAVAMTSAQDVYVPPEAGTAKSDLQNFLDLNPEATPIQSDKATEAPYKAYIDKKNLLSIFDGAGNLARSITVETVVALPFDGLALALIPAGNDAANNDVQLLGFAAGKEDELVLPPVKEFSGKLSRLLPWLEDIDNDGTMELCLYDNRLLRCLRWNATDGKWEWIESLEGRTIERDLPPILWRIHADMDEQTHTMRGKLNLKNLTRRSLTLTPPPVPILESVPPRKQKRKSPLTLPPETAATLVADGWTIHLENPKTEIVIPPEGETEITFEAQPENANSATAKKFSFDVIGRTRWRRFDVTYDIPLTAVFDNAPLTNVDPGLLDVTDVTNGRLSQEELDRCATVLAANRRHIAPEIFDAVSDAVRMKIVREALLGGGGYTTLKASLADATTKAILKGIAETPDATPTNIEQLLWLALMNLDPDEYADALASAGGSDRIPTDALLRLLAYRGNLLDIQSLARILATWPNETVSARAREIIN